MASVGAQDEIDMDGSVGELHSAIILARIRRNSPGMRRVETATRIDISIGKSAAMIDRRLSVAPMMDWTDDR
jgi:hypothetical protein